MGGRLMSAQLLGVIGAVLLGVLANDIWSLSAPAARRIVMVAAKLWARDTEQAQVLSEEWRAYIDDRPGQILKLGTAFAFLTAALGRAIGHRFQSHRRRVKPAVGARFASIDYAAAQANAVSVALLVGLISSFAPLVWYAADLNFALAMVGWATGITVAVLAVTTSVVFGFFVARAEALPRDATAIGRLARILSAEPDTAELHLAADAPHLVRPFVDNCRPYQATDASGGGLVRPYVTRDGDTAATPEKPADL
jgi:hypothetical protein